MEKTLQFTLLGLFSPCAAAVLTGRSHAVLFHPKGPVGDTVMASFFIPQLGSQIYAMAGMRSRLHFMADEPGPYEGHNQQFSGRGYSDMHFKAIATSRLYPESRPTDQPDRLRRRLEYPAQHHTLSPV